MPGLFLPFFWNTLEDTGDSNVNISWYISSVTTCTLTIGTINTTDLSVNITGLEEDVRYNITVRAYTSVGPGPHSDPVSETTLEDGTYSTSAKCS